jgi:hypothetical protein
MNEAGGEALLEAGYHGARAGALFDGVPIVTARAPVQLFVGVIVLPQDASSAHTG